jgi:hypothetical protein
MLCVACGAEDRAVVEMERSLQATNDAIGAALVAHELFRHLERPVGGTRHGTAFGCPVLEQTGPDASHVLLLDYPVEGCVASSLLPPSMAGHVWMDVTAMDGALARVDSAVVGGQPLSGAVMGSVERRESSLDVVLDGRVSIGEVEVELALTVSVEDYGAMTLDGRADIGQDWLRLRDVVIGPEDVIGRCAVPSSGRVTWFGDREVELELGASRVPTQAGRFVGEGDLCLYAVPFWP